MLFQGRAETYNVGSPIGRGSYGYLSVLAWLDRIITCLKPPSVVYRAENVSTGQQVAFKHIFVKQQVRTDGKVCVVVKQHH
jgi:hypothetical protein